MAFRQICDDWLFEVDTTPPTEIENQECGEHLGSGDAVVTEMDRTRRRTFGTEVARDPER